MESAARAAARRNVSRMRRPSIGPTRLATRTASLSKWPSVRASSIKPQPSPASVSMIRSSSVSTLRKGCWAMRSLRDGAPPVTS